MSVSITTIDLPAAIDVEFRRELGSRQVRLDDKSPEWVVWAISFGLRQSIADAAAGKVGDDAKEALLDKYHRVCVAGEVPTAGAGGPRISAEEAGWIQYFRARDCPVKLKGTPVSRKTLPTFWAALAKMALAPKIRKACQGLNEAEQVKYHKEVVPELIARAIPLLREREESNLAPGAPGWYIQQERLRRQGAPEELGIAPLEIDF